MVYRIRRLSPKRLPCAKRPALRAAIALAVLFALLALIFYGPFAGFKRLWINTAMYSSRFKFLATALYPKAYIDAVLETPFPEATTVDAPLALEAGTGEGSPAASPKSGAEFAEIKGNYFRGYIIKLEDPRRLFLVEAGADEGRPLEDLAAEHKAAGGVNGGGYRDDKHRGRPWGTVIAGGRLTASCTESGHTRHTIGGLTKSGRLAVGRMTDAEIRERGFEWAVEFGPILVINGEKTAFQEYAGGLAPRTAIGQTAEGHILLAVVDGRQSASIGAAFEDMQKILYANGAVNAIVLDGGSSSCMVYGGVLANSPSADKSGRLLPNALVFW